MTQFALDFSGKMPPAAQERIHDGMKRADENADPKWRHIFDACVLAAARKKQEITSDDVLAEIESLPDPPKTHNLAAIGPAMKRAAQMGIIARTERFCRSSVAAQKRQPAQNLVEQMPRSKHPTTGRLGRTTTLRRKEGNGKVSQQGDPARQRRQGS